MQDDKKPQVASTGITEELWEFPCDYILKVMGASHHPMERIVTDIVERHVAPLDKSKISSRPSRTGKYTAITATFTFIDKAQVEAVYADLDSRPEVAWKL